MKHAYLIIANRNHQQLQKLLTMIDDSRNDIYLMIDKKSRNFSRDFHVDYSNLNYVKPIKIYWGDYSQIQAILNLLKVAVLEHYSYYHLLSGLDLPLVNQDRIHNFFDMHPNKEFVKFNRTTSPKVLEQRLKHHLFRHHIYGTKHMIVNIYRKFESRLLKYLKEPIPLNKLSHGSEWFSIDNSLAQFIINNESKIYSIYKYGSCVDEMFLQILLNYHPKFKNKLYSTKLFYGSPNDFQSNLRYMDWWDTWGSSPHIWTINDYSTLINAKNKGYLFSRRFDEHIDESIIDKVFNDVLNS